MSRTVILVVVDDEGRVVGALPPYEVVQPWWMETADIVAGAKERFGLDVTVLRLLHADRRRHPGGTVHYTVQLGPGPYGRDPQPHGLLQSVTDQIRGLAEATDPRRASYARPGGPQATLAWARAALDAAGRGPVVEAVQQRTWNLSAIWRLTTPTGVYWVKQVPPFFAHEASVVRWLRAAGHGASVPTVVADDGPRLLMAHTPGEDLYHADADVRRAIAADMHAIQADARIDELLCIGVPDRRMPADSAPPASLELPYRPSTPAQPPESRLAEVVRVYGDPTDDRLRRLVDGLPQRLARVADCGLPDTLVHGDLHGGNVIGRPDGGRVILDWGDCVVGNPAIDILRLTDSLPPDEAVAVQASWARWWREEVPGCDPLGALGLLRPVHELYLAAVYADFLASIERTEQPYHRDDVPECLARASALAPLS